MGIYLNPNNAHFTLAVKAPIYVDKSKMISVIDDFIDQGNSYICVSRARRFGKTINANMLTAYYSKGCDSRELFDRFKIAKEPCYGKKLNKYNVIYIDVNSEYQMIMNKDALLLELTGRIKKELRKAFPSVEIEADDSLARALLNIYSETGEQFIIIMDEYDVLVREQASRKLFDEYLSFLNGMFKSSTVRPAIALAYLTGILPVVRDKIQSKLNNFIEYTMVNPGALAEYIGFTEQEVQDLCAQYGMDFAECSRWYDGYRLNDVEIYNPRSVVSCIQNLEFGSYWNTTSSYQVIVERIQQNFEGTRDDVIKMIAGEEIAVNVTIYLNTMDAFVTKDDVFTYLIHLGYLAYDRKEKTCRIPNEEIRQEWHNAVAVSPEYKTTDRIIKASKELLAEALRGNAEAVAQALDVSHIHVTSNRSYNNEDALQSAIYLAFIYALNKYTVIKEMTTGKGYADVVFIPFVPDLPAMIIELKRNGSTESALAQIRQKQYFASLAHYTGALLFVGIIYDEKAKTHPCAIERLEK